MLYLGMVGPWQIIIIITLLLGIIPTLIALVDILRNKFEDNNKIVWVLVVLFFNLIGAILYFIIGRKQRIME
ncbi:PLD nuclease N-terminal domain-containing protein [Lutibacter sp.]|uniref:PLD nuclease N-terminal domain-containing protein n=1 Tax=Lutibacter sp. TaxID=1925666 RepID=UPI0034A09FB8